MGFRVAPTQFGGDPVEVPIGLGRRHAGLKSAERIVVVAVVALVEKRVFAQILKRDVQNGCPWETHRRRQDADDLARDSIHYGALTQDARGACEVLAPEGVAQQDRVRTARSILGLGKIPANSGLTPSTVRKFADIRHKPQTTFGNVRPT